VGLANTRERLAQIYPDDHEFRFENLDPTGFCVTIEIPREKAETRAKPSQLPT